MSIKNKIIDMDKKIETRKPIVINCWGGPCAGKSTIASGVFYRLKSQGVDCELVTEYAKSKVWENAEKVLNDQLYVFGKQNHKMEVLRDKVNIIITDSPLLLSLIYGDHMSDAFKRLVIEQYESWHNLDIFIKRQAIYMDHGRVHTLEDAKAIDKKLIELLEKHNPKYSTIDCSPSAANDVINILNKAF